MTGVLAQIEPALASFLRGDVDAVRKTLGDASSIRIGGKNPLTGLYTGADEILGFLALVDKLTDGTILPELVEVLEDDTHHAVLKFRTRATRRGRTLDVIETISVVAQSDGSFATSFAVDDQEAYDAFWS